MWNFFKKAIAQSCRQSRETAAEKMHRISIILSMNCFPMGNQGSFRVMTQDINIRSARIFTSQKISEGQEIDVHILLYSNVPPIRTKGHIIWCKEHTKDGRTTYEGGVEFEPIDEDNGRFLERFIEQYSIARYEPSIFFN